MSEQQLVTDPNWGAPPPAPPPAAGPKGSERTRVDAAGAIGVDHDAIVHGIADWASTLPPKWQAPAAFLATLPADMLGSLAEMLSSPESLAAAGAKPTMAAIDSAAAARHSLQKPADIALDALVKKTGIDPDALDLASTRMRLQAARSRTRQVDTLADLAQQRAALSDGKSLSAAEEAALYKQGYSPASVEKIKAAARQSADATPASAAPVSPVASAPAAATVPASGAPSTAAQLPTATAPPSVPSPQRTLNEEAIAARRAAYQAKQATPPVLPLADLRPGAETTEFLRLIKAGKTQKEAMAAIQVQRDLQAQLGLKTPTADETRFPKGNRGKVPE